MPLDNPQQMSPAQRAAAARQLNDFVRDLVVRSSIDVTMPIQTQTLATPQNGNTLLTFQPRQAGLLKSFIIQVSATITNTGSTTPLSLTQFGPANLLSNITFIDLGNYQRHNTTGWHVTLLDTVRRKSPFAAVHQLVSSPINYGYNFQSNGAGLGIISAPATIASGGAANVYMTYNLPICYDNRDLRGAIWMGVYNATSQLQLTVNNAAVIASGDPLLAVYSGNTGTITNVSVQVYQNYYDQVPVDPKTGTPILPQLDLGTMYMLNQTSFSNPVLTGQDYPMQFSNFRDFLSTIAIFDQNGTFNGGGDINYWAMQSANFVNIFKRDPYLQSLITRNMIGVDLPRGCYLFDTRGKPISSQQYGNMQLLLNASSVASGASVPIGWEQFGKVNTIFGAGSLPAG